MGFRIVGRHLGGIVVLEGEVHEDARGFFLEAFRADQFRALGLPDTFVQENHSFSRRGVLRGLHFQWDPPMGKLMRVTAGSAYLVAVDIRPGSPDLGRSFALEVGARSRLQVWAPPGFARGFQALADGTEVHYKCTGIYNPAGESGILWNDRRIGLDWPILPPRLSEKDARAQTFDQWLARPEASAFSHPARRDV